MELLQDLLAIDWDVPCTPRTYCSLCRHAVCQSCCPTHVASAHGIVAGPRRTIDVSLVAGEFPAVTAVSVRHGGLGYCWNEIQRVDHQGTSYVMLGREQPTWERDRAHMKSKCTNCNDRVSSKNKHCSPACKVAAVQQGQSRDIIQSLVQCDFTQAHLLDRFCTMCRRAFCSQHCADHGHHHLPDEEFQLLTILREENWVLIPVDQLPLVLVQAVKRLLTAGDGVETVAIRPRQFPDPHGGPRLCNRCQEAVAQDDRFCSLLCKAGLV